MTLPTHTPSQPTRHCFCCDGVGHSVKECKAKGCTTTGCKVQFRCDEDRKAHAKWSACAHRQYPVRDTNKNSGNKRKAEADSHPRQSKARANDDLVKEVKALRAEMKKLVKVSGKNPATDDEVSDSYLVFDTGADHSMIRPMTARKHGLSRRLTDTPFIVQYGNDTSTVALEAALLNSAHNALIVSDLAEDLCSANPLVDSGNTTV
jgi:hypothetical protein